MPLQQRYISNELTHLFGKKQEEKGDTPYETLCAILSGGILSPHGKKGGFEFTVKGGPQIELSENTMYNPDMICFCDIPFSDLGIHMHKYGGFGVSFPKNFIVCQGGTPVFYIPKQAYVDSSLTHNFLSSNKEEYFNKLIKPYRLLFFWLFIHCNQKNQFSSDEIDLPTDDPDDPKTPKSFEELIEKFPCTPDTIWKFLDFHLFSFLKFFDHRLPDNDENNYYFEREWRILGRLKFIIEDVCRIIIPRKYAESFRSDFPNYHGQLDFSDDLWP
jgi:hypothetical protein